MRELHVAVAQVCTRKNEIEWNMERIRRQVEAAALVDADVIHFAECVIHTNVFFDPDVLARAEPVDGPLRRTVSEWAKRYGLTILVGMFERDGDDLYIVHVACHPDGRYDVQRKHATSDALRNLGFKAGPIERTVFDIKGVRCAIIICAETRYTEIYDEMRELGVELVFLPVGGCTEHADMVHAADLATEEGRALFEKWREQVFISTPSMPKSSGFATATANTLGDDGHFCHFGHCLIFEADGFVRAQIPGVNVYEHQLDQMAHAVLRFP